LNSDQTPAYLLKQEHKKEIMSGWMSRIVFPVVAGIGFYQLLKPEPNPEQIKKLKDPEMVLMGQLIRGQGASELSTLRQETKQRTKDLVQEYGKQKEEEDSKKEIPKKEDSKE